MKQNKNEFNQILKKIYKPIFLTFIIISYI